MLQHFDFLSRLGKVMHGDDLTMAESYDVFSGIVTKSISDVKAAAFLTALAIKGESGEEISGVAQLVREHSIKINAPEGAIDVCGTGGSGLDKLNISTAVALILASLGVAVAKHGNRAVSSRSGSADILSEMGVNIDASPELMEASLKQNNICFMMAPIYHPLMKNMANIRKELGFKTIFNLIGPLTNPASVKYQLLGTSDSKLMSSMVESLKKFGVKKAWVVSGIDGMDEVTISGSTSVLELDGSRVQSFNITPIDAGLEPGNISDIKGGDPSYNAKCLLELLRYQISNKTYKNIVLLNAAAALMVCNKVDNLREGVALSESVLKNGKALSLLESFVRYTSGKNH